MPLQALALVFVSFREALSLALLIIVVLFLIAWQARKRAQKVRQRTR
jgi:ABC-type transport system involved in cytochrome bd biosynthesis fused ATPase/permease subunit